MKVHRKRVVLTNVSLTFNTLKVLQMSDEVDRFFEVRKKCKQKYFLHRRFVRDVCLAWHPHGLFASSRRCSPSLAVSLSLLEDAVRFRCLFSSFRFGRFFFKTLKINDFMRALIPSLACGAPQAMCRVHRSRPYDKVKYFLRQARYITMNAPLPTPSFHVQV